VKSKPYDWIDVLIFLRNPLAVIPDPVRPRPFVNAPWDGFADKKAEPSPEGSRMP
jgi:hypothetical protein